MDGAGEEINFPVMNNTIRYNVIYGNGIITWFYCQYNNKFIKNDFVGIRGKDIEWEKVIIKITSDNFKIIKNYYEGNYWDTWHYKLPKPIDAKWIIRMFGRDVLKINGYIFDWHPSLQPNCS